MKLIYPKFGEALWGSSAESMATADLRVVLLTNAYTYSAAHEFMTDLPADAAAGRVALSPTGLASVSFTSGVLDAADYQFSAVSGSTVQRVVVAALSSSGESASRLIYYSDENAAGSALSVVPTGGTFTVTIANLATIGG